MFSLLYPLVLATLGAGAPGEEAVKPPSGPQPNAVVARMAGDSNIAIQEVVQVPVFEERREKVNQGGVEREVTTRRMYYQSIARRRTIAAKDIQGYDTNGKKIDADTVRRRLQKDRAVLISADGRPVDPFYLKLAREGTLVLVVSSDGVGGIGAPTPRPAQDLRPEPTRKPPLKDLDRRP